MKVKELIEELKRMPQDADVEIAAYGMDAELYAHMQICARCNVSVGINDYDGSVWIYAEEEDCD